MILLFSLAAASWAQTTADEPVVACLWRDYPGTCQDGDACAENAGMSSTFSPECTAKDMVCCLNTPLCTAPSGASGSCMLGAACLDAGGTNVTVNGQCDKLPFGVQCCLGARLVGIGSGLDLGNPAYLAVDPSVFTWGDDKWTPSQPAVPVPDIGVSRPAPAPAPPAAPAGYTVSSLVSAPTRACDVVAPQCTHMRNVCRTPFVVDKEFMPFIAAYNRCARTHGTRIQICSSYRSLAHNRRVGGASGSNHLVGHAIDMYLLDRNGGACTEACLLSVAARNARPGVRETLACFESIRNSAWGGNPRWNIMIRGHLDVVHLDDRINTKYNSMHVAKRTACDADYRRPIAAANCAWFEASASLLRDENDFAGAGDDILPEDMSAAPSSASPTEFSVVVGGGGFIVVLVASLLQF